MSNTSLELERSYNPCFWGEKQLSCLRQELNKASRNESGEAPRAREKRSSKKRAAKLVAARRRVEGKQRQRSCLK